MERASTPFVFLDLFDFDGRTPPAPMELGWHPHSGVATVREPTHGAREEVIGAAAVGAAREAGVEHLIWSTLSDVEKLTDGFEAPVSPGTRSYKHPSTFKTSSP